MKKAFCLLLAIVAVAALFAGCETKDLDSGEVVTTGTTAPNLDLTPDKVEQAMSEAGITGTNLSPDEQAKLQSKLHEKGYDVTFANGELQVKPPAGITLPATTAPKPTEPKTMPKGEDADVKEVEELLAGVQAIFKSQKYTVKGTINTSMPGQAPTSTPTIIAVDKEKIAFETNGADQMALSVASGEKDYGQSQILAAYFETIFGKTVRIVATSDKLLYVFPDKKIYTDFSAQMGMANMDSSAFGELATAFSSMFEVDEETDEIKASKVKDGGKQYTCATITSEGDVTRTVYFLGKDLKRVETTVIDPTTKQTVRTVWIVDSISNTVDAKYFGTDGMKTFDPAKYANVLGQLNGG